MTNTRNAPINAAAAARQLLTVRVCGKHGCLCAAAADKGHGVTHCPTHADEQPSLSVGVKSDKVLVHCQAACAQDDVVAWCKEHRCWPADTRPNERMQRRIVAAYDYRDAHGTLRYQVVRYAPKSFHQRRPDGAGGWHYNLQGVCRVLYRLPELLAAAAGVTVYVVEGEQDADRLAQLGLVTTCNSGGAGKWRDDYNEPLRGRRITILPDNDAPGRAHAAGVKASLVGVAADLRVVVLPDLPDGGDVSDWLDAGGTTAALADFPDCGDVSGWLAAGGAASGSARATAADQGDAAAAHTGEYRRKRNDDDGAQAITVVRTRDGRTVELILDGEQGQPELLVHGGGRVIEYVQRFTCPAGHVYTPRSDRRIADETVPMPGRPQDHGDAAQLAVAIEDYARQQIDVDEESMKMLVTWVMLTWVYEAFPNVPYVHLLGPAGSGKSRTLQVVGLLGYHPFLAGGNVTAAALLRIPEIYGGTLLIDESGAISGEEQDALTSILNSGYQRGANVVRARREGDQHGLIDYPVYGPKMMAGRRRFEDPGLERRFLVVHTRTTARRDIPLQLPETRHAAARTLRAQLLDYRVRNLDRITCPPNIEGSTWEPAIEQIILPLWTLAPTDAHREAIRAVADHLQSDVLAQRTESLEATVVRVLVQLFRENRAILAGEVTDRVNALRGDKEAPARKRPEEIGRLMRSELGMRSRHTKHGTVYDLTPAQLQALEERYLGA